MTLLNGPVKSVTLVSSTTAREVTDFLINESAWFEFMPLPDGEYRITFKEENYHKVRDLIESW